MNCFLRSRRASTALVCLLMFGIVRMAHATVGLTFQGLVRTLNTGGSITLSAPAAIVLDAAGDCFISDTGNSRIVEVNAQGVASVLTITGLSPALAAPAGIAIDGSGNLYIADMGNSRVVEVTPAGVGSVVSMGSVTLSSPKGIALDPSGDIFVADTGNSRVVEVTAGGSAAALSITGLSSPSTLNTPKGLGTDVAGNLYIADSVNNRIVKVAAGGTVGTTLSIELNSPSSVSVDGIGNVYIADTGNSRIAEVDIANNGTVLYTNSVTLSGPLDVAVDVFGVAYVADTGNNRGLIVNPPVNYNLTSENPTYSLNKSVVGFGHIQLGSSTAVTLTLPFTIGSTALGSVKVFTSGVQNLDFTAGVDTTCSSSTGTSASCSVEISFLPTAPGLRIGAVVMYDGSQNPILTLPLYGHGDAPVAALAPNTGTVISTGGVVTDYPFQLALDGAGNMYVGNYVQTSPHPKVVKIAAGGGSASVISTSPLTLGMSITGIAVDGAGNLFIADYYNDRIVVVTPGGVASVLSISSLSPTLGQPTELAFDAAGNLYIADYAAASRAYSRIVKVSTLVVSGTTSSGLGKVIGTGSYTFASSSITGVAVGPNGTIYIAGRTSNTSHVVQVTAAGVASLMSPTGITFSDPQGAFVDAMGNVYVEDSGNNRMVRITTAGVPSVFSVAGLTSPSTLASGYGVAADGSGNLYIPDWNNNRIVFVNVSGAALTFASTHQGSTSTDSPKTATVTNLGNQPLALSTNPTYTADFSSNAADSNPCTSSTSLLTGTLCDVSVKFTPQSVGSLSAGITVTDDTLNVTGSTQQVSVSGVALSGSDTTSTTVASAPTSVASGQTVTITATIADTATGHTSTVPTGPVTFTDTLGSTTNSLNGGTAISLSGGKAILTGATLSGVGTHTVTANYAGVTGSYVASTGSTTVQVSAVAAPVTPAVMLTSSVNPVLSTNATTLTSTVSSASGTPTGTVSFVDGTTPLGQGILSGGVATLTTSSLTVGTHTITAAYSGDANFTAASSGVLTQSVLDFSLGSPGSGGPPSQTVVPGGAATYALNVVPTSGTLLPAPLILTVSGLPPGATAAIAPTSWTRVTSTSWSYPANVALVATSLTIQLPTTTGRLEHEPVWGGKVPPLLWGVLLLPFAGTLRRTGKRLRCATTTLLLFAAAAALGGVIGCSSPTGLFSQKQQTYTVTVTATSGTLSHSTTVSLTVE
jgi:Bacterial Ig-like domain (group 3)/NHL repeat